MNVTLGGPVTNVINYLVMKDAQNMVIVEMAHVYVLEDGMANTVLFVSYYNYVNDSQI